MSAWQAVRWQSVFCGLVVSLVAACTTAPMPVPASADFWHDEAFDYSPTLVSVDKASLFKLDPALETLMRDQGVTDANVDTRVAFLIAMLFGPEMKNFGYRGGHSTTAAETWRNRSGDCLSLTVLTRSLAAALELPVQVQEVQVPVGFDRRGGVDFLNQHVNVLLRTDRPVRVGGRNLPSGNIVIDFEPQIGSNQRGVVLSDESIVARYYNNIAAEHLAHGRDRLAYAHFKAAISADPGYASAYSNLAQLYLRAGLTAGAERLLRHAVAINGKSYLALQALQTLLLAQGRDGEAMQYQALLRSRRAQDPYYWLGLGLQALNEGDAGEAIDALERAQALTNGFEEVHQGLAIAYWRAGKLHKAQDQLAVLGSLQNGSAKVATMTRKFIRKVEDVELQ